MESADWFSNKDILKAMRNSGLAHLLAISGLHMSLIGGLIFFTLRFALSLFPVVALSTPTKKIAAISAVFGIGLYLLLSEDLADSRLLL